VGGWGGGGHLSSTCNGNGRNGGSPLESKATATRANNNKATIAAEAATTTIHTFTATPTTTENIDAASKTGSMCARGGTKGRGWGCCTHKCLQPNINGLSELCFHQHLIYPRAPLPRVELRKRPLWHHGGCRWRNVLGDKVLRAPTSLVKNFVLSFHVERARGDVLRSCETKMNERWGAALE
jgi:hypothetical protein